MKCGVLPPIPPTTTSTTIELAGTGSYDCHPLLFQPQIRFELLKLWLQPATRPYSAL